MAADSLSTRSSRHSALPLVMTVAFAGVIVITRHRRDVSMMPATCASQVLVVLVLRAVCLLRGGSSRSGLGDPRRARLRADGPRARAADRGGTVDPARRGRGHLDPRGRGRAALVWLAYRRAPDGGRPWPGARWSWRRCAGPGAGRRPARRGSVRRARAAESVPRALRRRKHLAGIHDPVRVEQLLDTAHDRQQVAVLELEVAELPEARCRARRCRCRRVRARPRRASCSAVRRVRSTRSSSGSSRNATWKFPSPAWPTMPPRSPDASSAPRACAIAGASSDNGTATSVVIARVPG